MALSEWRKLPLSLWHNIPEQEEWRCVLYGHLLSLKQDSNYLYYRTTKSSSSASTTALSGVELGVGRDDQLLRIVKHYFHLSSNLADLYAQWSSHDPNFKKKASQFTGIRILRQDPWEALVSFICSSNNNIARISQMVEKLCVNYGPFVANVDGRAYHDFPSPEALAVQGVESKLRTLGFGYRARYIYQTAVMVSQEREKGWLESLCNPEAPAFGGEPKAGAEMRPEGREGYREAHEQLLELQGVGPKVSDCVCLMGLGWGRVIWQIAQRDYRFGKGSRKSLTKATYDAVGNHFRKLWGQEAGWAHSVLFTADLRSFADRLAATKKVNVAVKEEDSSTVKIETEVTSAVTLIAPKDEEAVKVKATDIASKPTPKAKAPRGKKRGASPDELVHKSQTTETRRVSKRTRRSGP
ncbi:8-oxoguanine DNA glycosylase N-terminal [Penicillium chermesinum]|nr:8-oxoguanine DNA glycosylase N-terminal [Penicillium chermesinum]